MTRGAFCANPARRWAWAICWNPPMASCASASTWDSNRRRGYFRKPSSTSRSRPSPPARPSAPRRPEMMRDIRLGDDIDDFCVRCKRVMNHNVVSVLNGQAAKVRCRTCHSDHDFRHEQAPPPKVDARKAALFAEVLKKVAPGEVAVVDDAELEIISELDGESDVDIDGDAGVEVDAEDEAAEPVDVVAPEPKPKPQPKPRPKPKKGRGRPKK